MRTVGENVLPFLPLGGLAGPRRHRGGILGVAAPGPALSTAIEIARYRLETGRVASVDDVPVNVLGASLRGAVGPARTAARPDAATTGRRGRGRIRG